MKVKLFLSSAFAATLIVGSAMWLNIKNEEAKDSVLLLENVEALANGENSANNEVTCYSSSDSKKGSTYYDCGDCSKQFNSKGTGESRTCRTN